MPRLVLAVVTVVLQLGAAPARAGGPAAKKDAVVIAAAASLTEVLPRVASARGPGEPAVAFRFDASSRLARQIEAGAAVDGFVAADAEWMDHLEHAGLLAPGSRVDLAGNRLVLVVPREAASAPRNAAELAAIARDRLALAGESVPAGRYGREALESLGMWASLKPRVVSGDSVRTALAWAARGEVGAAIVYATDARVEPRVRVAFVFPESSHRPIIYPAAVLAGARHADGARRFLEFCRTPAARALFEQAGFSPPAAAKR